MANLAIRWEKTKKQSKNGKLKTAREEKEKKRIMYTIDNIKDTFICGDAVEEMKKIPDKSIGLVVTSPPYNLKNSTGNGLKSRGHGKWANAALVNGYSTYDDNMPYEDYIKWQRDCLKEMMRVLKDNGAIFYNHKWRVQKGLIQDRHEITQGFPVRQIIIWKRNGGINFNPGYFLPTYEVIYIIAQPDFNLVPHANAVGDIWEFTQEMNNKHPAPFPVSLIERIISSTSAEIVLDPFMGSGTTAIAAKKLNRNFVGIEIAPEYCEMSRERLQEFYGSSSRDSGNSRESVGRNSLEEQA